MRDLAYLALLALAASTARSVAGPQERRGSESLSDVRFMTLDPGHFHAALVHKEMYAGVSPRIDVYAALGSDLLAHLKRIAAFNERVTNPTRWEPEIHAGPDSLGRMLRERPGNVVVISGRNRGKIQRILASVQAGLHVLADKPWILDPDDLPALEAALAAAEVKGVVAYDIMTERFEITTVLQRELVNDRATFGTLLRGSEQEPAAYLESAHHLMKEVAGAPNIRPAWFFDTGQQGEGLNDIGAHLVDLAQWTLFPGEAIDPRRDVRVLSAYRWPTPIARSDFARVTGEPDFPAFLRDEVRDGSLEYFCNTFVSYTLRDVHVGLNVIWDWEARAGAGDTHFAVYRGSRSRIEVRQSKTDDYRPELYVVANQASDRARVLEAVTKKVASLQAQYPGVGVGERGAEIRLTIPGHYRTGHEAHFAEVTANFLGYLRDRSALAAWERSNMLAKYYVTTTGTKLSRKGPVRVAPRLAP